MFLIRVEVENALNEMLGKHEGTLLKQEVNQAVLTETKQQNKRKTTTTLY